MERSREKGYAPRIIARAAGILEAEKSAAITEAPVIEGIPTHLGLAARAPPRSAARLLELLQAA